MKIKYLILVFILLVSSCSTTQSEYTYNTSDSIYKSSSNTCISSDSSCWPTQYEWDNLNKTVHGHLVAVIRPGETCYKSGPHHDPDQCDAFKKGYFDDIQRESYIGTMQNTNWEDCEMVNSCPVDVLSLQDLLSHHNLSSCSQGGLPHYALNSTSPDDIATVIRFAAKRHIAFNIKNSGHDYLGRSTSPDSITVWTHSLQRIEFHTSFQPEGCNKQLSHQDGFFTLGGGVKWLDAYQAADRYNVTIVGGAQPGVSTTGGWLQGGGHSILTPTLGLGVDQVVQLQVVLTNGSFITVNACQYPDLFWALRGGGGGTFGVVTEATVKTHPYVELQTLHVAITSDLPHAIRALFLEFARYAPYWAEDGWGGYLTYHDKGIEFIYSNPRLSVEAAAASVKPFFDFVNANPHTKFYNQIQWDASSQPGFYPFYMNILNTKKLPIGIPVHTSSRLIPRELFATNETISRMVDAIMEGASITHSDILPPMSFQILAVTPFHVQDSKGETSVQPAFRKAVWHLIFGETYKQSTPLSVRKKIIKRVSKAADPIRRLTPGSGAYFNEADLLEPVWHQSFWGDNYERLAKIKKKYDPTQFFNCWKCIGWNEQMLVDDKKYKCYRSTI
ncbi:uncharacterized protein BX663DRAFT_512034 [Cokeromyces recurvatus]|uniref:uncharacterized protein n=1 Tax=Cokeromyces recurvatus TaxID=90255 RepID=UPI002220F421|nr:uncharacterized protein BX663DRAFT_512034 [Cokeromyces recurvatus]KAI7902190.1 hypothetical protein BX663DRAFT_512034 [Cokeromyces recurvatus]